MAKYVSIKQSALNVLRDCGGNKEEATKRVSECIWGLTSFSENNKVTLTASGNAYQIKYWASVLIYFREN